MHYRPGHILLQNALPCSQDQPQSPAAGGAAAAFSSAAMQPEVGQALADKPRYLCTQRPVFQLSSQAISIDLLNSEKGLVTDLLEWFFSRLVNFPETNCEQNDLQ